VVEWSNDVDAADWIIERLHSFFFTTAQDVASFVPEGFSAYARVLHPAWRTERDRHIKVRWADLAREKGVPLRTTTRFEELESTAPMHYRQSPRVGTLQRDELEALVKLLAPFTSTPHSCWFGVWEGYGWMQGPPAIAVFGRPEARRRSLQAELEALAAPAGPRVQIPGRSLALYSGQIEEAAAFCEPPTSQSPNLWWPDDHAWCVASEIDFHSTYLGGAQSLVDEVLRHEELEALPATPTDRITD
jgi:hypothetical protein